MSVCSSPSGGGKPALTGTVTIDKTSPEIGDTLIASYADGNGTGEAAWQWLADDEPIEDANSTTYTVTASDLEKTLTARVGFLDQEGTISSEPTAPVTESTKPALTGTVSISKMSPEVGDTLTAEYKDGNGTGDRVWQWLADDVPIEGANSDTYTVTASELDKTLAARVSFANQSDSVSSEPTAPVTETTKPKLTGTVTIDKTSPKVGDTLTAEYTGGNGTGNRAWQWLADGTAIPDTNSDTYVVAASDLSKTLAARVNFADQSGNVSSEPTAAVTASSFTVTFNSNGGSTVLPQTVTPGESVEEPIRPTKTLLYFDGWYTDNETFQNRWDFTDPVNSNLTLYAQWNETLNSIEDITEFLDYYSGSESEPLPLKVVIDLGLPSDIWSGWRDLLTAIARAGDYVALDLSACTMDGDIFDHNNYVYDPFDFNPYTGENIGVNGMNQIVKIILPDVVASVGKYAFIACTSLTEVSAAKATSVDWNAFDICTSLTEVSFPEVTSISTNAFMYCASLTKVSFPKVRSIGEDVFAACTSLTEVSFPEATSIGDWAFHGCISLKEVSFPEVTSLDGAFQGCKSLTKASFPKATSAGGFNGCTSLKEVSFPEATNVGGFSGCTSLTKVSFPKATSIVGQAFGGCTSLTEVSFPEVTSIDNYTFSRCDFLRTITLGTSVPTVGYAIFGGLSNNPTVTVKIPAGATGYGTPGSYNDTGPYIRNWANGFRGKGWDGNDFIDPNESTPVTIVIEEYSE